MNGGSGPSDPPGPAARARGGSRHPSPGSLARTDEPAAPIRLVATDLDGTFWDSSRVPPAAHVEAVRSLERRGVTVLVATSRRPRIVRPLLERAGLSLPAVLIDGAVGDDFRTGERFHEVAFGHAAAVRALATFRRHGLEPCLYVSDPDVDVALSSSPSTCRAHVARLGGLAGVRDLDVLAATATVYAFSVLGLPRPALAAAADELSTDLRATVVLAPDPDYGGFGLLVNPGGVTKWSGILAYCELHDIRPDEVAAVGDGLNDLEMLRRARLSIGVRGGRSEVLAVAHACIDPPSQAGWRAVPELLGSRGS